jgi:O-acetyl-ADP-ribose deacetylase
MFDIKGKGPAQAQENEQNSNLVDELNKFAFEHLNKIKAWGKSWYKSQSFCTRNRVGQGFLIYWFVEQIGDWLNNIKQYGLNRQQWEDFLQAGVINTASKEEITPRFCYEGVLNKLLEIKLFIKSGGFYEANKKHIPLPLINVAILLDLGNGKQIQSEFFPCNNVIRDDICPGFSSSIAVMDELTHNYPITKDAKGSYCVLSLSQVIAATGRSLCGSIKSPMENLELYQNGIEIIKGKIQEQRVDAIVNAANKGLEMGGGVDGAICSAAGASKICPDVRRHDHLDPGGAIITPGYDLGAKGIAWVIHTVGPDCRNPIDNRDRRTLLTNCYKSCFKFALGGECYYSIDNGEGSKESLVDNIQTIAFPSISTGIFNFPHEEAARIAITEAKKALTENKQLTRVIFVCWTDMALNTYFKAYSDLKAHPRVSVSGYRNLWTTL